MSGDGEGQSSAINLSAFEPAGDIQVVDLDHEIVPKDIAEHIELGEHNLRKQTADKIVSLFVKLNAATLVTFFVLVSFDVALIWTGVEKPSERLIDSGVVKMLIGATTVQLGAAVALIMAYLFPGAPKARMSRGTRRSE